MKSVLDSLPEKEVQLIITAAQAAKQGAYAPYSRFAVGAALLTEEGQVYQGSNIENASYSLTVCAERVAIFTAIAEGERQFKALAVAADTKRPVAPCGACRQVLAEFKIPLVIMINQDGKYQTISLAELLPYSFAAEDLPKIGEDSDF